MILLAYQMRRWALPVMSGVLVMFTISSCIVYSVVEQLDRQPSLISEFRTPILRRPRRRPQQDLRPDSLRSGYEEGNLAWADVVSTVESLRLETPPTMEEDLTYDILECSPEPPEGYPHAWKIVDVLTNWNPDDTTPPLRIHQSLCMLDWRNVEHQEIAKTYAKQELPFVIQHHPELWGTAERWSHKDYLSKLLNNGGPPNSVVYRTEFSHNNHMMYWKLREGKHKNVPPDWTPPTENIELTYDEWYKKAVELEQEESTSTSDHWYLRLNGEWEAGNDFLYDELPLFQPVQSLFMVDPRDQRGINCRFGMKGVIAETHYDFSRNWIFLLGGAKRYILAHPNQCLNLELHTRKHPSARHSRINWSNPMEWKEGRFEQAMVQELILQAGDAMYLPTSWFHFIVSLNLNYQCNARSGITLENQDAIKDCGFF